MLSLTQARRVAIRATGLGEARPSTRITTRHLRKVVSQVGLLQLDSVNAVARAHELLLFSRLGPLDNRLLHDLVYRKRELYEGWLHVASLIPTGWWPLLASRRDGGTHDGPHHRWVAWRKSNQKQIDEVSAMIRERGPIAASDLEHLGPRGGAWWGWSEGKHLLEGMFMFGEVAVTTRRGSFERVYDLTERIIPADVLAMPGLSGDESRRRLLLEAAHSLGVGTLKDLVDYHRLMLTKAKPILRDLVAEGALVEHEVEGWSDKAYALPTMKVPRSGCPDGRLVSPFDPLVWYRQRNERLYAFRYTIEIYTPEPKRVYGYYVLPFLQGDRIVARVDVRSDRKTGVLRVPGAFAEVGAEVDVDQLARELRLLAQWQGCGEVVIGDRGDLAGALRRVSA